MYINIYSHVSTTLNVNKLSLVRLTVLLLQPSWERGFVTFPKMLFNPQLRIRVAPHSWYVSHGSELLRGGELPSALYQAQLWLQLLVANMIYLFYISSTL